MVAIAAWLENDQKLITGTGQIVIGGGLTFVEFGDLRSKFSKPDELAIAFARGVLWPVEITSMDDELTREVLVVRLHETDPTPTTATNVSSTATTRRGPWRTVALIGLYDGVEARHLDSFHEEWGRRAVWPF